MIAEQQRHRKLLVVDDEPLVRETLCWCLRDEYEVTAVASGEEAIEASLRDDFPVVILDLCMEGLSGIETLRRLKKIRELQNVIILTAYESTESAISALNLGAFNYLTKPFERAHLKAVISRGFEVYENQHRREQEMQQRLMSVHDSFFSLLCHEFNTPLNIILGFSELLLENLDDPEHKSWVHDIRESGAHLHDILMEIVDYIGASHLAVAGVQNEFVPGALFRPLVKAFRQKEIDLDLAESAAFESKLRGPQTSVLMIARKLIRMASHQSPNVRLAARIENGDGTSGPRLCLEVGGTGLHASLIKSEEIEQLFEPYKFTPGSEVGYRASLGLELATCRKIAEYVQGSVDCQFNPQGELDFVAKIPVTLV